MLMAGSSRLSKLKEAAEKKRKGAPEKMEAEPPKAEAKRPEQKKEAAPARPAKAKPENPPEAMAFKAEKPAATKTPIKVKEGPLTSLPPQPAPLPPPERPINDIIMTDERITELPDKLQVLRAVLQRYDELAGGAKSSRDLVDEEIKRFLSKRKQ
jgi:hypothetical protein